MERFKTSKSSESILERLSRATGVGRNIWSRAALGLSLSLESLPSDACDADSDGMEHTRPMLFGEDEAALLALLRERHKEAIPDDRLGRIVKIHVERGLQLIHQEYERLNRRGDELMLSLLDRCIRHASKPSEYPSDVPTAVAQGGTYEVMLDLGQAVRTGEAIRHCLNGPGTAPHLAVMGKNGTGKTRTAVSILSGISSTAPSGIPFLCFDYAKGDIASNIDFVQRTGASVVRLPGEVIGLAPLAISKYDENSIRLASHRFRDTISAVVRLGPKQKKNCLAIIEEAYSDVGGQAPDLDDVVRAAKRIYADNSWQDDSLTACLTEFTHFPLFRPAREGVDHSLFRRSHIVDIHRLPEDLRKLTVFLVLDRLYSEIMALPDAPLDSAGNRQLRLIIVIDEAHHYLPCKQPTLEKMVREVRSKGVAVWLLSQSPDDFDQPKYNFAREMGLSIVFSCVLEKPKMLEAVLGGKINPQRLSQLPAGVALTRIPGADAPIEIQAWRP